MLLSPLSSPATRTGRCRFPVSVQQVQQGSAGLGRRRDAKSSERSKKETWESRVLRQWMEHFQTNPCCSYPPVIKHGNGRSPIHRIYMLFPSSLITRGQSSKNSHHSTWPGPELPHSTTKGAPETENAISVALIWQHPVHLHCEHL